VLLAACCLLARPQSVPAAGLPCPLVYSRDEAVLFEDAAGTAPRRLGAGRQPALSGDARVAVWVEHGEQADQARLVLYDLASGQASQLAKPGGYLVSPRFAPTGRTVLFMRRPVSGPSELWRVAPGEPAKRLGVAGGRLGNDFFEPGFVPDTGQLVWHDMDRLYLAAPDLSEVKATPLTQFSGGQRGAFTSADRFSVRPGTGEIVFSMPTPGTKLFQKNVADLSSALFLYDPATSRSQRLTPEDLTAFGPVFSPDGTTVFFFGYRDKQAGGTKPFRLWAMPLGQPARALGPGEDPAPPAAPARP
jgi:dipeptidyl aminopeptidase/acylaminoacyl peptidase